MASIGRARVDRAAFSLINQGLNVKFQHSPLTTLSAQNACRCSRYWHVRRSSGPLLTAKSCGLYNQSMSTPILTTKLYIPPPRPKAVHRPHLVERLNDGLHGKLTLVSAPAGFGKTTLVSNWLVDSQQPVAWLSLDNADSDLNHFLSYFVAALQMIEADLGAGVLAVLQSPQPPATEALLTTLLNEISAIPASFVLVLDDYHLIDDPTVDQALTFLLEHLPPQMHLVITTREDPPLPLARLRGRGQMTELRAADLRFSPDEAAEFLNQVMGLNLESEAIAALETRTEGWIAGLQLAALSLHGQTDITGFIESFTGSHHFVLDYLVEEVLSQQPESVQEFLLCTSVLERLCGPLCDAVLGNAAASGQETLDYLARANLFLIPLGDDRRWYRYHHLFADLLRQRLHQRVASSAEGAVADMSKLHGRASQWYEDNGLEVEAFLHAAAANDIDRAARLIEGDGMPLHLRGVVAPVLNWIESLPPTTLDARPSLQVMYASASTLAGRQISGIEKNLQAAEKTLQATDQDARTRDLVGHIAAIRAMLATPYYDVEPIIDQSRRALEYLRPDNVAVRTIATWTLGYAYQLQGDRAAACKAYSETISNGRASGNIMIIIAAATCLGIVQESENQLHLAAESYQQVMQLAGDPPWPTACEAYLGLARILYQWNDLDAALQQGQMAAYLAPQLDSVDTPASCGEFLARLRLARGDVPGAAAIIDEAETFAHRHNFVHLIPDIAAVQVLTLLRQGDLKAATHLAQTHELPVSQARVYLAQEDAPTALAVLESSYQEAETKGLVDEQLQIIVLQAVAHHAHGETDKAVQVLADALVLAEPSGFIRLFVDEGALMAQLLAAASARGIMPDYTRKLLAAFDAESKGVTAESPPLTASDSQPLVEPLSDRELEVLHLVGQGLSNREISERLFLALSTVKGHNRNIFDKLQVQRRTEAVARARELGLL